MANIIEMVRVTNPARSNLKRGLFKIAEETGEVSEAYINLTSTYNGKGKTWDDLREEISDVLILAIDMALVSFPNMPDNTHIPPKPSVLNDFSTFDDNYARMMKAISSLWEHIVLSKEADHIKIRVSVNYFVSCVYRLAYTVMPDKAGIDIKTHEEELIAEIARKLAKWKAKMEIQAQKTGVIDNMV